MLYDTTFFINENGREPAREWIKSLRSEYQKTIGRKIQLAFVKWPPGPPLSKNLDKGLWEIRIDLGNKNIARVFVTVEDSYLILLHGFIKKSQKTPLSELAVAKNRLKQVRRGRR